MHCIKISPEFERQAQRSKVKVTRDKNTKSVALCPGVVLWGAVLGALCACQFYSGAKISARCLVNKKNKFDLICCKHSTELLGCIYRSSSYIFTTKHFKQIFFNLIQSHFSTGYVHRPLYSFRHYVRLWVFFNFNNALDFSSHLVFCQQTNPAYAVNR